MDPIATLRPLRREPPHNDAAEMAMLGAILHNNRAFERVVHFLKPEHFASRVHGRIFEAVATLIDRSQIADPITLKQYFEDDDDLAEIGGYEYLLRLAGSVASIVNAEDYGLTIHDLFLRRQLISVAEDIATDATNDTLDDVAEDQVRRAEARIMDLALAQTERRGILAGDAALAVVDRLRHQPRGGVTGLSTGLLDLDQVFGGLHAPDLVILGGRPGMGKTTFAVTIARRAASIVLATGRPQSVAFFSLEMSQAQIAQCILAQDTGISVERQRRGEYDDDALDHLDRAAAAIKNLALHIDDTPKLTLTQLRAKARQVKRQQGLHLIIVDYLQLMDAGIKRSDNRVHELTVLSGGLKGVAKEFNVPVLALSQLSRAVESREDKRPQLSDLRESGSIEQDADSVWFAYREEYYLAKKEPQAGAGERDSYAAKMADWHASMNEVRGLGEILVEKNRHGNTRKLKFRFDGERSMWTDFNWRSAA